MKKTYIIPSTEVMKVASQDMMATSFVLHSDETVDTAAEDVQLGRNDDLFNESLWDNKW